AHGAPPSVQRGEAQNELPPELANAVDALTSVSSYFDAILDSETVPMNPIPGWVSANQDFTTWLAKASTTSAQKRKSIVSHLRSDLELEVLSAVYESSITPAELETWRSSHFDVDIRDMASLG